MSAVFLVDSRGQAASYRVGKGSEVSFVAKITAASFVAKSEAIQGTVELDSNNLTVKVAEIAVKADSFRTGVAMRDGHMRDKYLEAEKFPLIRFMMKDAEVSNQAGQQIQVTGIFVIKEVSKESKINVTMADLAAATITVESSFPLNISDYGIPQPRFAVVKMEPVLTVTVKLVLEAQK